MQVGADLTLIEGSRRGDRDAFARIIERYQRAVYAVAFSGVRDRGLADDITQETFVVAWRRLDELRDARRLGAWLCGVARNRARDLRKQMRREAVGNVGDVAHPTTPFDELSEAETERIIAAALDRVPDVYREPLVLYYFEERSVDDVARSLGISAATTNKRLSRGRRYLAASVATVERGLVRRGPSPALAASVLAAIGVFAVPSHVEASTGSVKGTTMHKLALAAVVAATLGGAGVLLVDAKRTEAQGPVPAPAPAPATSAASRAAPAAAPAAAPLLVSAAPPARAPAPGLTEPSTGGPNHAVSGGANLFALMHGARPALPATMAGDAARTDCVAVGRHLAELDNDTSHGPNGRPDPAECAECAARYSSHCESERWSVDRRVCILGAADLINAHLCAGGMAERDGKPAAMPAHLACAVLAPRLATIAQGAGLHPEVGDLDDQIAAACEAGSWSVALRTCLANGSTMDALQACIMPAK